MEKIKILFLAANPKGTSSLRLDEEIREITSKIQCAAYRDSLEIISKWAVRPDDLQQSLLEHQPHIVHFSGHGTASEGIMLEGQTGNPKAIPKAGLSALFRNLKDNVRVVLLNACYSRSQAETITEVIDCAVGMKRAIGDRAAVLFAGAFYRAIGFGRSVKTAFESGKTALILEDIPEDDTPEMLVRKGVDASQLKLIPMDVPSGNAFVAVVFVVDQLRDRFCEKAFMAALETVLGADVSKVRIAMISRGSTRVRLEGEPTVLGEIVNALSLSDDVLRKFATETRLLKLVGVAEGREHQVIVSSSARIRILLVENNPTWQHILWVNIRIAVPESSVQVASSFLDADRALGEGGWHLLVTDIGLPPCKGQVMGMQLVDRAKSQGVPCIVVSGSAPLTTQHVRDMFRDYDVRDFFSKEAFANRLDKQRLFQSLVRQCVAERVTANVEGDARRNNSADLQAHNATAAVDYEPAGTSKLRLLDSILELVDRKLRKIIRAQPSKEKEVQDAVEGMFITANVPYSRETDSIEYSSKTYVPDFTVAEADLAVEVKLCTKAEREREMIAEINDDMLAYSAKYRNLVFVIYDCGIIRDADRFARHFEKFPGVVVRVINH